MINGPAAWLGDARLALEYTRMAARRRREGPPPEPTRAVQAALPDIGSDVEIDGIRMRIDPRMSPFNIEKLTFGRHTRHERTLLARLLTSGDRVLELGGGIGMVAIECARRIGSENVTSFEANPEIEDLIRTNYALNDVRPDLHMAMVGPERGERVFNLSERFSRSSLYDDGTAVRSVSVPVEPFDEVMASARPTVLVVDIQGGERELFDYANFSGVRAILVELHPFIIGLAAMLRIRQRMRREGFRLAEREGNSYVYKR